MKRRWALAVVPFVAIACQSSESAPDSGTAPAPLPASSPNPATPSPAAPPPAIPDTANGAVNGPATKVNTEINPNRTYQLKDLEVRDVKANGHPVKAWLMDTEGKRAEGMMYLKPTDFPDNYGMLFVFGQEQPKDAGFWMQHCILGLDIIYTDANGKVISLRHGKPFDETSLKPDAPYKYVLELKEGIGVGYGIKPGTKLEIPKGLKAKDSAG